MSPPSDLTLGTAVDWRFAATVGQRLATVHQQSRALQEQQQRQAAGR